MEEFKLLNKVKYLIDYSDEYILSSFPKSDLALKINLENNLYNLLENTYRANINKGNIRIKHIKEIIININLLDYYIGKIKNKKIIKTNRYTAFLNCIEDIIKMSYKWLSNEEKV